MSVNLTEAQLLILAEMNRGMYLIKRGTSEGLAFYGSQPHFTKPIKAGTINALMEKGMIRKSKSYREQYLLTDKGREYRGYH